MTTLFQQNSHQTRKPQSGYLNMNKFKLHPNRVKQAKKDHKERFEKEYFEELAEPMCREQLGDEVAELWLYTGQHTPRVSPF